VRADRGEHDGAEPEGAEPEGADESVDETEIEVDAVEGGQISEDPSAVPGQHDMPHAALPLEDLPYDPETMGLPPAAGHAAQPAADGDDAEQVDTDTESDDDYEAADDLAVEDDDNREATLADFFGSDEDDEDDDDEEIDESDTAAEGLEDEALRDEAGDGEVADIENMKPDRSEPRAAPAGRKGRTSVPSWDDIMFGAKDRGR
ncbi:MAG: hypothetical protein WBG57_05565, partial [Ornithinimicrobium sp.]